MNQSFLKKYLPTITICSLCLNFALLFPAIPKQVKNIVGRCNLHVYSYLYGNSNRDMVAFHTQDLPKLLSKDKFLAIKQAIIRGDFDDIALVVVKNHKIKWIASTKEGNIAWRMKFVIDHLKIKKINYLLNDNVFVVRYHDTIKKFDKDFDAITTPELVDIPVFVFNINTDVQKEYPGKFIPFPDDYTLGLEGKGYWEGWENIARNIPKSWSLYSWDKKVNKIFWRGKLSDCAWPDCQKSSRLKIVQMTDTKDFVDAKFASLMESDKALYESMGLSNNFSNFVKQSDGAKYKYQIVLDGVSCTTPGYLYRLYSSSLVIKQETKEVQWFYHALKPGVHYIPVKEDLSDIEEKYEWLRSHDEQAKEILDNARNFVKKYAKIENIMYSYIPLLLNKHAESIKFDVDEMNL